MSIPKKKVDKKLRRIEVKYRDFRHFLGKSSVKQSFFRSKKSNLLVFRSKKSKK